MPILVSEHIFDVPPLGQGENWASPAIDVPPEAGSVSFCCYPQVASTLAATAAIKFSQDDGVTWHSGSYGTPIAGSNSVKNKNNALPAGTVNRALWSAGIMPALAPKVRAELLIPNAAGCGYDGGPFVLRVFATSV